MEIEITKKTDNLLLERTEVEFKVRHQGESTPTRKMVKETLSEVLGIKKDVVVVNSYNTQFGKGESVGFANVYKNVDKAKSVEEDHILKRNKLFEEKKKEGK